LRGGVVTGITAVGEVVALASELIRIDTTNTGDADTLVPERKAAEYVAARLDGWVTTSPISRGCPGAAT
jgi:acetylornithine deacetylase/succinyl-diaminopimelate desuccinylase-like protein